MTDPCDCSENTDPRKLVRDGTHQAQRTSGAPDPARVPVDERRPEHAMVFASAYAAYLRYYDLDDVEQGTWQDFFASDVSAQLAVAAIEDVTVYRTTLKALLRSLEDPELPASAPAMIAALGAVFDCLGTLARRLDTLQQGLPADQPLRATLGNLIRSQLSPMLQRLIGYYLAGDALGVVDRAAPPAGDVLILGQPLESFDALITGPGLSTRMARRRRRRRMGGLRRASTPSRTRAPTARAPTAGRPGQPPRHPQPVHGDLRHVPRGVRPRGRRGQGGRARRRSSGTATSPTTPCSWRS